MRSWPWLVLSSVLLACGGEPLTFVDAGLEDARIDAAEVPLDAPAIDGAEPDAPAADAAAIDATIDAAAIDAPAIDASALDAVTVDADVALDAATLDATTLDAGVVPDPAPGVDTPGEHTGAGCPDSNQTTFTIAAGAASAYTFSGSVTAGTPDGVFYVRGPGGETVGGAVETAPGGGYAKTLPLFCGANLVKLVWDNGTCPLVLVYAVNRTTCVSADITATVQWDDLGRDWELHLVKPGGRINDDATDCTWTSCISASPDWGVAGDTIDDPHKDIDNTSTYGPENIWLARPEPGTYTVLVEHWGSGDPGSDGFVTLNVAGRTTTIAISDLAPQHVWTVATIAWPSGVVTTSQAIYDCSGTWQNGCQAALP